MYSITLLIGRDRPTIELTTNLAALARRTLWPSSLTPTSVFADTHFSPRPSSSHCCCRSCRPGCCPHCHFFSNTVLLSPPVSLSAALAAAHRFFHCCCPCSCPHSHFAVFLAHHTRPSHSPNTPTHHPRPSHSLIALTIALDSCPLLPSLLP